MLQTGAIMRNTAKWGVVLLASLGFLAMGCGASSCPSHFKTCGGKCVDIYTDPANCGACGTACAGGNVCSAGACGLSCTAGETACGGSCRDLQTDDANCGTCGNACTLGQHCTAGVCGCPPGMSCGPTALVYSDAASVPYPTAPEALTALGRLKGTGFGPFATISSSGFPAFDAAYDAGGFDLLMFDNTAWGLGDDVVYRLGDWVSCGGRLMINSWTLPALTGLASFLGVTVANPACYPTGITPRPILSDTTAVNLWSGLASVPSPLTASQPNVWVPYCGSAVQTYDLTPTAGGSIAGRFTTAGTGPGAMAVTKNGHVIVSGFFPSDYRGTDGNGNGFPDVQELYENQIAYLVNQGPPGLTCSTIETFDVGTWPISPWTLAATGIAYGSLTAACAHDGVNGFTETGGGAGNAPADWYYRTTPTVGNPGQKLSMWIKTPAVIGGRAYLGAGATANGAVALTAGLNSGNLLFQAVTGGYAAYAQVGTPAAVAWVINTWYRMEVQFGSAGALTGVLYASDGVTVVATTSATVAGFAPGGVGIRSFGGPYCLDTVKQY